MRKSLYFTALTALLWASGCKVEKSSGESTAAKTAPEVATTSSPKDSSASAGEVSTQAPNQTGFATGTPPGSLSDWVAEIKKGVAGLPALAPKDPAAAQKQAMDLYLTRQEYIEMYWSAGRLPTTPALSQAVKDAETRFHELMSVVGPSSKASPAKVQAAVDALGAQYDVVLREARSANVKMNPTEVFGSSAKAKNQ